MFIDRHMSHVTMDHNTTNNKSDMTTPPSGIATIPTDMECLVSMEDITEENYVEYQIHPTGEWKSSFLSQPIIEHLLQTQFNTYMERIQSSDCQAELKRLLQQGPPIYISDPYGLPLEPPPSDEAGTGSNKTDSSTSNSDKHVMNLWYASDRQIHSSILQNAVVGDAHATLWNELQSYLVTTTTTTATTATEAATVRSDDHNNDATQRDPE